jgi:hypothetical protein
MQSWLMSFGHQLEHLRWVVALTDYPRLFTTFSVIHYFSVFLVVGTSAVVDLRLAGLAAPRLNVSALAEGLFPWTWTGLVLSAVTGFFMFMPEAAGFFTASAFFIKLALIVVAVVVALFVQKKARRWGQAAVVPASAKLMALLSLALWIGVVLAAVEIAQQADV